MATFIATSVALPVAGGKWQVARQGDTNNGLIFTVMDHSV